MGVSSGEFRILSKSGPECGTGPTIDKPIASNLLTNFAIRERNVWNSQWLDNNGWLKVPAPPVYFAGVVPVRLFTTGAL